MIIRYLVFVLFFVTGVVFADPPENYPFLSYDAGLQKAKEQKMHMFVYFGSVLASRS